MYLMKTLQIFRGFNLVESAVRQYFPEWDRDYSMNLLSQTQDGRGREDYKLTLAGQYQRL